jgi:hypothetical protein
MDARAEASAPPKTSVYLPVEDLPAKRAKAAMTADEQSKLKKELIARRRTLNPQSRRSGQAGQDRTK